jgi:fluoride ion exporter CrcB/FEX
VHVIGASRSDTWKGFFGPGLAGGFTTMSGLALITAGAELGLSSVGYLYWMAVAIQLVLGILTYWLGTQLASRTSKKAAS